MARYSATNTRDRKRTGGRNGKSDKQRTVFFHIGSIKTGSTGLQKFCYLNRDNLLAHDIDYIQFSPPQLHLPRWANADCLMPVDFDAEFIEQEIGKSKASRILISEEGLMSRPNVWQHPIFQGMRRVIVVYLRNSVELVASWASENALPYNFRQVEHSSGRGTIPIDKGIGVFSNEYRGMLLRLFSAISSDSDLEVVIQPFPPRSDSGESLIMGFLKILGVNAAEASELSSGFADEIVNQGQTRKFCDASCMLSDLVCEYGIEHLFNHGFVTEIEKRLQSGDKRRVMATLSKPEMKFIQTRLATPVEGLVADWGAPEDLSDLPKEYNRGGEPYALIDRTELKDILMQYLIEKFVKLPSGS